MYIIKHIHAGGVLLLSLNNKVLVGLPSKGIVVARTGDYPYVYHVTKTYRNEKGCPTNSKRSIGKLDKATGKLIPNNTYYEFYGDHHEVARFVTAGEIHEAGVMFLTHWMFSRLGIDRMLSCSFDNDKGEAIQLIASYMLREGNVMNYLDDFCERSLCGRIISGKMASRIFAGIDNIGRMDFFRQWVAKITQEEYIAYDVTSFSSYAEGIVDTEWGYNRDGERLPQINMGLYVGRTSRLPVFYVTYPGSIVDKSHLPSMMAYNADLGIGGVCFVMDKGFVSTANLEYMHNEGHSYIVAIENRYRAARRVLDEHKKEVRSSRCRIDKFGIFGMGVKDRFYGVTSTLHIYYDPEREAAQTSDMYRKIASEGEALAQMTEATESQLKKYRKHYTIEREQGGGFSYQLNHEAVDALAENLGYFCMLTNDSISTEEVISTYRDKDVIEKTFDELKNHIDMKRLRTHNDNTTEGKLFCAFLALILRKHIENALSDWMRKNKFTFERVLRELAKIRSVSSAAGRRLASPLTKKQRDIFSILDIKEQDVELFVKSFHMA